MVEAMPHCRLYLTLPARPSAALESSLAQALAEADVACVLLCNDMAPIDNSWAFRLRELTLAREIAFLIENDAPRAETIGADGIHITADVALYRSARDKLGQLAIIGVGCIESRHDAMTMAELGADYVAFGHAEANETACELRVELIAWWSEIFVAPCVAWDVETAEEAERLAGLGADFIALSTAIWQAEDVAQRIATIGAALRRARTAA
jgi:thiamine-phosphate pyrophosphorylase